MVSAEVLAKEVIASSSLSSCSSFVVLRYIFYLRRSICAREMYGLFDGHRHTAIRRSCPAMPMMRSCYPSAKVKEACRTDQIVECYREAESLLAVLSRGSKVIVMPHYSIRYVPLFPSAESSAHSLPNDRDVE